jgi:flagellar basal body-associated protein FliL
MNTDPASARTMNKVGWIILWVILGLAVLAILAYVVFGLALFGIVGLGAAG